MSTTITTTSRRLAALLSPVIPLADKSDTIPILRTVLLRGHGEHGITATATDRYRIGVCRDEKIAAPEGFEAVVPVTALRAMLTMFRATRYVDPELSLEFVTDSPAGVVHVSTEALGFDDVAGARVTYRLESGEYPKVHSVIESAFADAEPQTTPLALNVHFLADFAAANREGEPTLFYTGKATAEGKPRPIGVAVGEHFRGAIMQVRTVDGGWPAAIDEAWAPLVAPVAKRPAELTTAGA